MIINSENSVLTVWGFWTEHNVYCIIIKMTYFNEKTCKIEKYNLFINMFFSDVNTYIIKLATQMFVVVVNKLSGFPSK